jgi:hypothetical protein
MVDFIPTRRDKETKQGGWALLESECEKGQIILPQGLREEFSF